jgi:predicted SAM-dependent methyltransferase
MKKIVVCQHLLRKFKFKYMISIETVEFKGKEYPSFQAKGFASRFAFPFAKLVCFGKGVDIGCGKIEWCLPCARPIDLTLDDGYDAMHLPDNDYDFIFSSHLLEHLPEPWATLDYWSSSLKTGGVMFLYLPDVMTENANPYHLPWNNRKHLNIIEPQHVYKYMVDNGFTNIFMSGTDLNSSYMVMGEKNK